MKQQQLQQPEPNGQTVTYVNPDPNLNPNQNNIPPTDLNLQLQQAPPANPNMNQIHGQQVTYEQEFKHMASMGSNSNDHSFDNYNQVESVVHH